MQPSDTVQQSNPATNQASDYFAPSANNDGSFKGLVPFGFTGQGAIWFKNTPPAGWLICDGSSIKKTDYPDLWQLFGNEFGLPIPSLVETHFKLPDLRGRVPVGRDTTQTEFDTIGETGGDKNLAAHRHDTIDASLYAGFDNNIVIGGSYGPGAGLIQGGSAFRVTGTSAKTSQTGSGSAGNLQPYGVVNYIVKT